MIHRTFEINDKGRDFIISDLHGCYDLLLDKMKEMSFNHNDDRLFSVGDLVDRGPESMKCLELLKEPHFYSVRGNHEDMMIKVILHNFSPDHWFQNGGLWYINEDIEKLKKLCIIAKGLPYSITIKTNRGDIGICHAEPVDSDWNNSKNPTEYGKQNMMWGRTLIYDDEEYIIDNVHETYHGHSIIDQPVKKGNSNFIDTGAFNNGVLTMIQIN